MWWRVIVMSKYVRQLPGWLGISDRGVMLGLTLKRGVGGVLYILCSHGL